MMTWADVIKVRESLKEKVNNYHTARDYVMLCLYTMFPPRRLEYSTMKVTQTAPEEPKENTFVLEPPTFIFVEYKTAKNYGTQRFPVPHDLAEVLKDYVKRWIQGTPFLFMGLTGNHSYGTRLISLFKRETGKNVGVSMLRHIYITKMREGETALSVQRDVAAKMGHSIEKSMEYRFVDDED
jgi:hypothetical protein